MPTTVTCLASMTNGGSITLTWTSPANEFKSPLEHRGNAIECPDCGNASPRADTAPKRTWRHLDTMQFATEIHAAVPRCRCQACGVKTITVPWAGKHSRFTLMFEAFAIEVLLAAANTQAAAKLLGIDWKSAQRIMDRAVQRGLARRKDDTVANVGVDEKSFGRGHDYVSVLTDTDRSRVLEVVPERTIEACNELFDSLSEGQRDSVQSVSMDMWQAFMTSAAVKVPLAKIVHDRFHVAKYLGEAVDKVRRAEHRELKATGDDSLTGLRQLFLYNLENLSNDRFAELSKVQRADLQTGEAWSIKENFRHFWEHTDGESAKRFFGQWHWWAAGCGLKPIEKVAKMLRGHLEGLLNYFDHRVTNATAEGFNSRIQSIKSAARGIRNFANYRTRILFYCGKLDLMPCISH